uniref:Uncharacterized protein n=1 Tax=Salix viminalis TaxID=40686 RepID=A0A6N2LS97_SALVM
MYQNYPKTSSSNHTNIIQPAPSSIKIIPKSHHQNHTNQIPFNHYSNLKLLFERTSQADITKTHQTIINKHIKLRNTDKILKSYLLSSLPIFNTFFNHGSSNNNNKGEDSTDSRVRCKRSEGQDTHGQEIEVSHSPELLKQ